jgi:hypothetical protein
MSKFLSGLLGTVGGIANPIMGLGGLVSGLLGSLGGGRQNAWQQHMAENQITMGMQGAQNLQAYQNFMQNMAQNPQLFAQGVSRITPTLNANMIQQANNAAAVNSALTGMAGSPGQIEAASTQFLGPEMQANTLAAMQAYGNLLQQPSNIDEMLMNWGNAGEKFLPPPPSGAGGLAAFQNAYNNLPQQTGVRGAPAGSITGSWNTPITPVNPLSSGGFNPGMGIPNIPFGNSGLDLSGISTGPTGTFQQFFPQTGQAGGGSFTGMSIGQGS